MVAVDGTTGRYSLGLTALELGGAAGSGAVIAAAHPALERLSRETGETASLAMPGVGGLTYVDEVRPTAVLTAGWLGRTVPLHATSTGKALLAFLPAAEVSRVLAEELPAFTDATITTPEALAAELAATRARGYGTCAGELESSLYGVSAPVLDRSGRPLAVLSIWGPRERVPEQTVRAVGGHRRAGRPAGRRRARGARRQLAGRPSGRGVMPARCFVPGVARRRTPCPAVTQRRRPSHPAQQL